MPLDQTNEQVAAETGSLIRDKQELEGERIRREQSGEQSNRPTIEPGDEEAGTAKARLRAFEDEAFGTEAVRINGQIERGSGSPYALMHEDKKLQYTALERLVVAEQKLEDANAAAAQAEADVAAAQEHLEQCEKDLDEKARARDARAQRRDPKPAAARTEPGDEGAFLGRSPGSVNDPK